MRRSKQYALYMGVFVAILLAALGLWQRAQAQGPGAPYGCTVEGTGVMLPTAPAGGYAGIGAIGEWVLDDWGAGDVLPAGAGA